MNNQSKQMTDVPAGRSPSSEQLVQYFKKKYEEEKVDRLMFQNILDFRRDELEQLKASRKRLEDRLNELEKGRKIREVEKIKSAVIMLEAEEEISKLKEEIAKVSVDVAKAENELQINVSYQRIREFEELESELSVVRAERNRLAEDMGSSGAQYLQEARQSGTEHLQEPRPSSSSQYPQEFWQSSGAQYLQETRQSSGAQHSQIVQQSSRPQFQHEAPQSSGTHYSEEARKSGTEHPQKPRQSSTSQHLQEPRQSNSSQYPQEARQSSRSQYSQEALQSSSLQLLQEVWQSSGAQYPQETRQSSGAQHSQEGRQERNAVLQENIQCCVDRSGYITETEAFPESMMALRIRRGKLKAERNRLKMEIDDLRTENDDLRNKVAGNGSEPSRDLSPQTEERTKNVSADITRLMKAFNQVCADLSSTETSNLTTERNSLRSVVECLKCERDTLRSLLAINDEDDNESLTFEDTNVKVNRINDKINRLTKLLGVSSAEVDSYNKVLIDKLKAERDQLKVRQPVHRPENRAASSGLMSHQGRIEKLTSELHALRTKLEQVKEDAKKNSSTQNDDSNKQ